MSIFWLDGPKYVVDPDKITDDMYEERCFLPGIIPGGEDYLIRVWLNDSRPGTVDDPDCFEVEYVWRDQILKAAEEHPDLGIEFLEALDEAITTRQDHFTCCNDGQGDFAALFEAWPEGVTMTSRALVNWAKIRIKQPTAAISTDDASEFIGQIIDIFEDFLEYKGIDIPNDDRDEQSDSNNTAIIYGCDYGNLSDDLISLMTEWGVLDSKSTVCWAYKFFVDGVEEGYVSGFETEEDARGEASILAMDYALHFPRSEVSVDIFQELSDAEE